jgi:hypothetical protein
MNRIFFGMLALCTLPLHAAPFEKGDPAKGHALHEKNCTACHGTEVYTRKERKVKTAGQLAGRISGCNANTGAGWFPEEEQHVGAYLNQTFYKFK